MKKLLIYRPLAVIAVIVIAILVTYKHTNKDEYPKQLPAGFTILCDHKGAFALRDDYYSTGAITEYPNRSRAEVVGKAWYRYSTRTNMAQELLSYENEQSILRQRFTECNETEKDKQ